MADRTFIRLTDVTIPQGATVISAWVRFTAYDSQVVSGVDVNCYFVDADNPSAPASKAALDALSLTSAVNWQGLPVWTDGVRYNTPELNSILQTVIDRSGWSSGNAVILVIEENLSPTDVHRKYTSWNYKGGAEKAGLYVTWSSGTGEFFDNTKWEPAQLNGATPIETSWSGTEWNFNIHTDANGGKLKSKGTWMVGYRPGGMTVVHDHVGPVILKLYATDGILYYDSAYTSGTEFEPNWVNRTGDIEYLQLEVPAADNTVFHVTDITFDSVPAVGQTTTSTSSTASTTSTTSSTASTLSTTSSSSSTSSTASTTSTSSSSSSTISTTSSSSSTASTASTLSTLSSTSTTASVTASTHSTTTSTCSTSSTASTLSTTSSSSSTSSTASTLSTTSTSSSSTSSTASTASTLSTTSSSSSTSSTASTSSTLSTTSSSSSTSSTASTTTSSSTASTLSTTSTSSSSTSSTASTLSTTSSSSSTSSTTSTLSTTSSSSSTSSTASTASSSSTSSTASSTSTTETSPGELIFYPAASGDDGYCDTDGTDWRPSNDNLLFGATNIGAITYIRFPNVTIPSGATIQTAFIRFTAYQSQSAQTVNVTCYFEDNANPGQPSSGADVTGRSKTSGVDWDDLAGWTNDNTYNSPSLVTPLQEVIDLGGWNSGQAVMALIQDNGSDNFVQRQPSAYDYLSGAEKAELHVTYT